MRWRVPRTRQPNGRGPSGRDALVAGGWAAVEVVLFLVTRSDLVDPAGFVGMPVALVYILAGYAVLVLRRRAPLRVFGVLWLHSLLALLTLGFTPWSLGLFVAVYTVAAQCDRAAALLALAGQALNLGTQYVSGDPIESPADVVLRLAVAAGFASLPYTAGVRTQAHRVRLAELERQREQQAREAIARERARVARELHDIVSHAVSVIVLQSTGGRAALAASPPGAPAEALAQAVRVLGHIEGAGRQAMVELRRLLGVLRDPEDDPDTAAASGAEASDANVAQPGLTDLEELLRVVRSAGLLVDVEVFGEPRQLDASVDLTAYRIIQESLTNAAKHAGPGTRVQIALRWSGRALQIAVDDDGCGTPVPESRDATTRNGLLGLRERATLVGGYLEAGAAGAGGFRVAATLPLSEVPSQRLALADGAGSRKAVAGTSVESDGAARADDPGRHHAPARPLTGRSN